MQAWTTFMDGIHGGRPLSEFRDKNKVTQERKKKKTEGNMREADKKGDKVSRRMSEE